MDPVNEKRLSVPVSGAPRAEGEPPKRWRAQFPYHWDADELVSRRQLLKFCVYTSGALCACTSAITALGQLHAPETSDVVKPVVRADALGEGQAHYFNYPTDADQAMLLRLPRGGLVAYSQKCTHLSCAVFYQPERARLFCPCHEGVFNPQTGDPVAGPPRRRLPQIRLREEGGMIYAVGMIP